MVPMNTSELVVRDRKAEETERLEALARRKARFIFDTGKEQLKHLTDSLAEDSDADHAANSNANLTEDPAKNLGDAAQQLPKEDNRE